MRDFASAPTADISTYTFTPDSLAARASSRFASCSSAYCDAKPPALARVVASDEKKRSEGGEAARICEAQVAGGSVLMKRCSFPG
jgi:hypothetical protein